MIKCCQGCVAPKRHEACHEHCPDYNIEKILAIVQNAAAEKAKRVDADIASQKAEAATKALRRHRRH